MADKENMTRDGLVQRVRALTRDFSNTIFREQDIVDFLNEGINRFKQRIPELKGMNMLIARQQEVNLLPIQFQHVLAVYSTARCFGQDEAHYQASTHMNEFEVKLDELKNLIDSGDIVIVDEDGNVIEGDYKLDYVDLKPYWGTSSSKFNDFDKD